MWQKLLVAALAVPITLPIGTTNDWDANINNNIVNIISSLVTEEKPAGTYQKTSTGAHVIPARVTRVTWADICGHYRNTPVQMRKYLPKSLELRCNVGNGIINKALAPQPNSAAPVPSEILAYHISEHASEIVNPGVITIQPNRPEVWVNKDVYFTSSAQSYTTQLTILGQQVELRFDPVSYIWRLGDGTVFQTATAGGSWPNGAAHAAYRRSGSYTPSVDIIWDVFLRTGGSQWTSVPGQAKTTAYGNQLRAIEMEAVLTTR